MNLVADLIDHCPHCRTRVEIVCLKFRFSSVATLSACPNCAMVISEAQHGKNPADWFSAVVPAETVAALVNGVRARYRYSLGFLVAAVITAAVLRHTAPMGVMRGSLRSLRDWAGSTRPRPIATSTLVRSLCGANPLVTRAALSARFFQLKSALSPSTACLKRVVRITPSAGGITNGSASGLILICANTGPSPR